MEKFAIDLDKVLDEFELNEDRVLDAGAAHELNFSSSTKASKPELNNSQTAQTSNDYAMSSETGEIDSSSSVVYPSYSRDMFEPLEKLDMSEANFGPCVEENGDFSVEEKSDYSVEEKSDYSVSETQADNYTMFKTSIVSCEAMQDISVFSDSKKSVISEKNIVGLLDNFDNIEQINPVDKCKLDSDFSVENINFESAASNISMLALKNEDGVGVIISENINTNQEQTQISTAVTTPIKSNDVSVSLENVESIGDVDIIQTRELTSAVESIPVQDILNEVESARVSTAPVGFHSNLVITDSDLNELDDIQDLDDPVKITDEPDIRMSNVEILGNISSFDTVPNVAASNYNSTEGILEKSKEADVEPSIYDSVQKDLVSPVNPDDTPQSDISEKQLTASPGTSSESLTQDVANHKHDHDANNDDETWNTDLQLADQLEKDLKMETCGMEIGMSPGSVYSEDSPPPAYSESCENYSSYSRRSTLCLSDEPLVTNVIPEGSFVSQEDDHLGAQFASVSEMDESGDAARLQRPTSLNIPGQFVVGQTGVADGVTSDVLESADSGVGEQVLPQVEEQLGTVELTEEEIQLGKVAPFWIPDSDAPSCMRCDVKFTVLKRRHHCRACGQVLCSQCCGNKAKLSYMENKEARVCLSCVEIMTKVQACDSALPGMVLSPNTGSLPNSLSSSPLIPSPSQGTGSPYRTHPPNPNNPSEYCSTIPPLQQAATTTPPPPTVMVPVGVLKHDGTRRRESKQVMFSDGIRPGGDLTELEESPSRPSKKHSRSQKKVEKTSVPRMRTLNLAGNFQNQNFISANEDRLPPVIISFDPSGDHTVDDNPTIETLLPKLRNDNTGPIIFTINKNLYISVKIVNLSCCVHRICWFFCSKGLPTVGQDEVMILLEMHPEENIFPRDILVFYSRLYDDASKGQTVSHMGHTLLSQSFLGSKDHGGLLFIRPTFQCLQHLSLPSEPFLVGVLLQKWEMPWAKVFPLRLMLRLGSEFRYYPCPLFSVRQRSPVFAEIGHTIMNLLADFRNYQYMLPTIKGFLIHMEEKKTTISFPRNRYDDAIKALNHSNDHVLALAGNFSEEADSHLVCVQNDEGAYQTRAINIQNKPRKITGASFIVFNGALKSNSGLAAKSSIIEDGLMVQIPPDTMTALRQSLRDMRDFTINVGSAGAPMPDEQVFLQWVEDDRSVNMGVKSSVDGMVMDGIPSIRVYSGTDYMGETRLIRWTEAFFIHTEEHFNSRRSDPIDISRVAEMLAQACCIALTPHLDQLYMTGSTKIGLRVTLDPENVEYEVGSNGKHLAPFYLSELDVELVPVIHQVVSPQQEGPLVLELVFHILEQ